MKFINKVVVFVMGLVVIGVATTTINVVTQPKNVEKNVTFELLENNELEYNVFDKINEYSIYDNNDYVTNFVSILVNNNNFSENSYIVKYTENMAISDKVEGEPNLNIYANKTYSTEDFNIGDIITITFDVEQETPAIIKTLLFLTPLILSASLIGYLAFKKGDE